MIKITQCKGEGQGSCKRCNDKGVWNREWMCFLYKIEGLEGCYCRECVDEIMREEDSCQCQCDMMDNYEYAEDCEDYVEEDEP